MKKTLIAIAAIVTSVGVLAQGTLNFSTTPSTIGSDQPIFEEDTSTPIDGDAFWGELWAGADEAGLAALAKVHPLSGGGAGYLRQAEEVSVPNVAAGTTATVQIKAWRVEAGDTHAAAMASGGGYGESAIFTAETGGIIPGEPPRVGGKLTAFTSFSLVPEPSTAALGLLGAAALLLRRRK